MHVAVLGAGAIGTLFGARLQASGADVTLVGRHGAHLDEIRQDGVHIHAPDDSTETVHVEGTVDHDRVRSADWVLLAVKSYDTASAMGDVAHALEETPVLSVQNGLGNAETIAEVHASEHVIVGTTAHGASIPEPGHVDHAGIGETTIGRYFEPNNEQVEAIADALSAAGIETTVTDRPKDALWEKVLVNIGINAATALARVPNGRLVERAAGERLVERAVSEGATVARAAGRTVPPDVVDRTKTVAHQTATNVSSMRQDLEGESKTEIDALNGAIVARGDELGVETPVNRTLADLVRLAEPTGTSDF